MQRLKFAGLILLVLLAVFASCKPSAPVTPEGAFLYLRQAVNSGDAKKTALLLSQKSKKKIKKILLIFKHMDNRQAKSFSALSGIPSEKIKGMSVSDFMHYYVFSERGKRFRNVTAGNIVSIDLNGSGAVVRVDNGMMLDFIKEGPYWKLNYTSF